MAELIWAIVSGTLGLMSFIISGMSFLEKGYLFNNAYIWAAKDVRDTMDKKPYYRQSAIAFGLVGAVFFCMALECVLHTVWLWGVVGILSAVVLAYTIESSRDLNGACTMESTQTTIPFAKDHKPENARITPLKILGNGLILLGIGLGFTWHTGVCYGDAVFSALGIPAWSQGTSGAHYPSILGVILVLAGMAVYRRKRKD